LLVNLISVGGFEGDGSLAIHEGGDKCLNQEQSEEQYKCGRNFKQTNIHGRNLI